jgi:hypothetical protein
MNAINRPESTNTQPAKQPATIYKSSLREWQARYKRRRLAQAKFLEKPASQNASN